MTNRVKKSFYFEPDLIDYLQEYQYKNHLGSLSDAINVILLESKTNETQESIQQPNATNINNEIITRIADEVGKRYFAMWNRTESHTKFSDRNLQTIMEILNSLLIDLNQVYPDYFKKGISTTYHKSQVINDSEFNVQRKLENLKEKKDNRK